MITKLHTLTNPVGSFELRNEELDGIQYIVAPVVMLVEGVHAGSGGGKLYTNEEISKFPQAWNGSPVTVQHPMADGAPISANSPQVIETQSIGFVYNARWEDEKLKAEVWVNPTKAERVVGGPAAVVALRSGGEIALQVSTGHWSDDQEIPGTHNNEAFGATVKNIRPDHLALLPGGQGACSWADGCGIRTNSEGESMIKPKELLTQLEADGKGPKEVNAVLADALCKQGFDVLELAHEDVENALRQKVDSWDRMDGPGAPVIHYLVRTFDNSFIYKRNIRGAPTQLFRLGYTKTGDNVVVSTGTPVEVKREVTFPPVTNNETTQTNNKTEGQENMVSICALIENKATQFTEDDREFLTGLSAEQLDKLVPVVVETAPTANTETPDITKAVETTVARAAVSDPNANTETKPATWDDLLANADPAMRETIQEGQASLMALRGSLITTITANTQNPYTPEELQAMTVEGLRKLAAFCTPAESQNSFAGRVAPHINNGIQQTEVVKPLDRSTINWEK